MEDQDMDQDIGQLSEDEQQLLAYYRAANAVGKSRIMDNAFLGAYVHHGIEQVDGDRLHTPQRGGGELHTKKASK